MMHKQDWQRLWIQVGADRRKLGTMGVLLLVGILLWGRLILLKNVPKTGLADPSSKNASKQNGGDASEAIADLPKIYVDIPDHLKRNIFLAPAGLLAQPSQAATSSSVAPKSQTDTPEDENKSGLTRAQAIQVEGAKLRLQSVILGPAPAAVIENQVVSIGSTIQGFTLVEVQQRSVVVVKEQVRVELKMESP